MIISHNILAMNASRQLGIINKNIKKSTETLSSGYRINRAADDAAGLSISEKMRKQIRGLTQGIANAEDGISLCQVADGALNEVTDMIQRISELAVKAANGTNSTSDREDIQMEVSALLAEIDRVGDTTKFNEIYMFRGEKAKNPVSSVGGPTTNGRFFQLLGNNVSHTGYMNEPLRKYMVTDSTGFMFPYDPNYSPYISVHVNLDALQGHLKDLVGTQFYVNCCTDCCPKTVYFTDDNSIQYKTAVSDLDGNDRVSELRIGLKKADNTYFTDAAEFCKYIVDTIKPINDSIPYEHVEFAYNGSTLYLYDTDNNNWTPNNKESAYFCDSGDFAPVEDKQFVPQNQVYIQSGADAGDGITLTFSAINTQTLGLDQTDVLTVSNATNTINATKTALQVVSASRSRIGAQQNRLEHTIKNEENIVENTTAAESQIRDTDMATEMVKHSKNSILQQAGQAMLAQANHINEGVLTLIG